MTPGGKRELMKGPVPTGTRQDLYVSVINSMEGYLNVQCCF